MILALVHDVQFVPVQIVYEDLEKNFITDERLRDLELVQSVSSFQPH